MPTLNELRTEYASLFESCAIRPERRKAAEKLAAQLIANKDRYQSVGNDTDVPWYAIALIHNMESSQKFTRHLHNGDPLTAKTVQVPAGRPVVGNPPFKWEESAVDAVTFDRLDIVEDWTVPGILFILERFNGFGSRNKGIHTPYLWSFSNHYTRGKFVKDGVFDPQAVSQQCGAAILLKVLIAKHNLAVISSIAPSTVFEIESTGAGVTFSTNRKTIQAVRLQKALNRLPATISKLTVDGVAGGNTSDAFKAATGHRLAGDPRP